MSATAVRVDYKAVAMVEQITELLQWWRITQCLLWGRY